MSTEPAAAHNGKVALITGAASGIGHAIAKRYVEADGRVVIAMQALRRDCHQEGLRAQERAVEMDANGLRPGHLIDATPLLSKHAL